MYVVCDALKHYNNRNLFFHSYSQFPIYTKRTGIEQERIDKLNQHLRVKVNLNSSLFPVLEYRCPPPTYTQLQLKENLFKNKLRKCSQEGLRNLGVPHQYSRIENKEEFKLTITRKCQFNLSIFKSNAKNLRLWCRYKIQT